MRLLNVILASCAAVVWIIVALAAWQRPLTTGVDRAHD
jgi:hypothetical protein